MLFEVRHCVTMFVVEKRARFVPKPQILTVVQKVPKMKILILGGYGVFGGRLAELLSDIPNLQLLICGRNLQRAERFCSAFTGTAIATPVQLNRDALSLKLPSFGADLVVDASGPFQDYGDDGYAVIRSCIEAGVNYMDFADAADFVFGVSQFDQAAKDAGVFVLSGVSSFPVLTAAVLRQMARTMDIVSVQGGIAPSPFAGIGLNVMRAVVGYAGDPVKLTRGGAQMTVPGLTESMRYTIAVPGKMPLRNIHFSLVDVPDLQVLPPEHATLTDIWMGAGPVPEILHRILNILALARSKFGLPSFTPLAPLFYRVLNFFKFGEHRGGMFVHAKGLCDGKKVEQSWHLLAEGDDGPYIPSMAIEAIVRKMVVQDVPEIGARPATDALELADYEGLFEQRTIYTGVRSEVSEAAPLYRQVLGRAFDTLPAQIQAIHDSSQSRRWRGETSVRRGGGVMADLLAKAFGFPPESDQTPVQVQFTPKDGHETWRRTFGPASFSSVQSQGTGRNAHLLVERFGPISVALALVVEGGRLFLVPRRWSLFGLPLPKALLPNGQSFEAEDEGKFYFDVEIAAPVVGLIVAYKGWLEPVG